MIYAENLGSDTFVHVALAGDEVVIARAPGKATYTRGTPVRLTPDPGNIYRFDTDGVPATSMGAV